MLKRKWKPWQLYLFLGYLLILNLIVFGTLTFLLLKGLGQRSAEAVAALPSPSEFTVLPTSTSIPQPTTLAAALIPAPLPPIDIPPVAVPGSMPAAPEAIVISEGSRSQSHTPTLTATPTRPKPSPTASPTPKPSNTPTASSTPTASPTATLTNTPSATLTPTDTPPPTATPTATHTPTRRPTSTITATATLTPTPARPMATSTALSSPTAITGLTATPTSKPTLIAKLTGTPGPAAVQPKATAVVVAAALKENPAVVETPAARPAAPAKASAVGLVEAVALTNGSIGLSWPPLGRTTHYRVYSDMGSGFGVYLYKADLTEPAFVDKQLRAGRTYHYRVTYLTATQEAVLAQAKKSTLPLQPSSAITITAPATPIRPKVAPAPTALPADAVILGLMSDNSFTDDFNTFNLVGEVRNDASVDVGEAHIAVTFYDSTGTVIGSADGLTILEVIPPGETSPFLITLSRPVGLDSYSLRAVARPVKATASAQLAVSQVKRFEDEAGFFHIKGVVENTGRVLSERTKIVAMIYGRDNNIINLGFTYSDPPTLAPGDQGTYEVIFTYYPKYVSQKVLPFEE